MPRGWIVVGTIDQYVIVSVDVKEPKDLLSLYEEVYGENGFCEPAYRVVSTFIVKAVEKGLNPEVGPTLSGPFLTLGLDRCDYVLVPYTKGDTVTVTVYKANYGPPTVEELSDLLLGAHRGFSPVAWKRYAIDGDTCRLTPV